MSKDANGRSVEHEYTLLEAFAEIDKLADRMSNIELKVAKFKPGAVSIKDALSELNNQRSPGDYLVQKDLFPGNLTDEFKVEADGMSIVKDFKKTTDELSNNTTSEQYYIERLLKSKSLMETGEKLFDVIVDMVTIIERERRGE